MLVGDEDQEWRLKMKSKEVEDEEDEEESKVEDEEDEEEGLKEVEEVVFGSLSVGFSSNYGCYMKLVELREGGGGIVNLVEMV
ncbi:hypothetical protein LR48_Vigan05g051600 [Vigna angularis]|uniref:Uncharacterized protein n=1 Tax=Phaseolus angularis TaxID=3914 RepID=A0A0L9UK13_PHAAN|nr:hypothetical protein LR48_Vigan05g051600 [Vigna angularis]